MPSIAVCEDNPQHAEIILALLNKYQSVRSNVNFQTRCFGSADEILKHLDNTGGRSFDLFLLDIFLPGMNGIELAGELRKRSFDAPLIFLTSSKDFALDAFNVSASQYIIKPIQEQELFRVLDKITSFWESQKENNKYLMLSTTTDKVKVTLSSITCVESIQRTLCVHLEDGSKLHSKVIRSYFESAVTPLLEDSRFLHAHKSFVLNMAHVERLTPNSFVMKGGIFVPVPRYKYTAAKNKYMNYLSSYGVGLLGGK